MYIDWQKKETANLRISNSENKNLVSQRNIVFRDIQQVGVLCNAKHKIDEMKIFRISAYSPFRERRNDEIVPEKAGEISFCGKTKNIVKSLPTPL